MLVSHCDPFRFYTERRLVQLLGLRASTLVELRELLEQVPGACIFYHTHHLFLSHHFETPVVYNDFASWAGEALQEDALAERLAAVDLLKFTTLRELRKAIIQVIDRHMEMPGWKGRDCPKGDEFYFAKSKSFVMPLGMEAHSLPEFFEKVAHISNVSMYFHFLEARLRLGRPTNDFSSWMEACGRNDLAAAIDRLDPYLSTLEEVRDQIVEVGYRYGIS